MANPEIKILIVGECRFDFRRNHCLHRSRKYPIKNNDEPYYPINDDQNREKQKKYALTANKLKNFLFGGRLANYAYYDMDMTIAAALHKFEKIKKNFV